MRISHFLGMVIAEMLKPVKAGDVWNSSLGWVSLSEARASGKPALVFILDPACPRCRKLQARVVTHEGIKKLSQHFAMVHMHPKQIPAPSADSSGDDGVDGRDDFQPDGKYVPRVLFFDHKFNFLPEVRGGEPVYRYYYANPRNIEINMEKVLHLTSRL